MKQLLLFAIAGLAGQALCAQKNKYPVPEFSNEVYYLVKQDSSYLVRLEKGSSKMETKSKMAGMGGAEMGYILEKEKCDIRIPNTGTQSFIFFTGVSGSSNSAQTDSVMRANGIDPSEMSAFSSRMNDPSQSISLYKLITEKGQRKALMYGAGAFGKKKESTKYTFSVKKIRDGYYELIIDKPLPKGEYSFVMVSPGSTDGSSTLYAFGID